MRSFQNNPPDVMFERGDNEFKTHTWHVIAPKFCAPFTSPNYPPEFVVIVGQQFRYWKFHDDCRQLPVQQIGYCLSQLGPKGPHQSGICKERSTLGGLLTRNGRILIMRERNVWMNCVWGAEIVDIKERHSSRFYCIFLKMGKVWGF